MHVLLAMVVLLVRSGASIFSCEELMCVLGSLGLGCVFVRKFSGCLLLWAWVEHVKGQVVLPVL